MVSLENSHEDVPEGHWAYTAVDYCYANGLVGGISDTEFGPDLHIRRGDFLLMLYGAAGKPAVHLPPPPLLTYPPPTTTTPLCPGPRPTVWPPAWGMAPWLPPLMSPGSRLSPF